MDVANKLKTLKGTNLILTHHNADIDAITSAIGLHLGLKELDIKSSIGVSESVSRGAKKISKNYKILIDPDCSEFDNVILVDTSVDEQLKTIKNLKADVVIDHHVKGKLAKDSVNYIDPSKKSCAEMIYEILIELNIKIDKQLAKIIIAGIVADTAHLRLAEKEQFKAILELLKTDLKYSDVLEAITTEQDISDVIASLRAIKNSELYKIDDLLVAFSKTGSHEASSCRALVRQGVDIGIVFAIKKNELRISSRGRKGILKLGIDLSVIFKEIGPIIQGTGGGHDLAGSANGKSKNIEEVKKFVLNYISKKLDKPFKKLY